MKISSHNWFSVYPIVIFFSVSFSKNLNKLKRLNLDTYTTTGKIILAFFIWYQRKKNIWPETWSVYICISSPITISFRDIYLPNFSAQFLNKILLVWIQFSFFKIGCLTKTKESSLPYYLFVAGWGGGLKTDGFMHFLRALAWS